MLEEKLVRSPFQQFPEMETYTTLIELLLEKSKQHEEDGKTDCMECAITGEKYDFGSFEKLTRNIGSALYKRGLRKGDIVIYMQIDIAKQPLFLGGIWRANGIARASYPEEDTETLLNRVKESRTGWIYCEPEHSSMCLDVAEQIYWDVEIIVNSKEPVDGCTTIYELMEDDGSELPELDVGSDDVALILSTSGTTGLSKGALLTNRACIWMVCGWAKIPLLENKVNLIFTKGTHISGTMFPLSNLVDGKSAVYLTRVTKQTILGAAKKYQPGFIFGFPPFLLMLAQDPTVDLSNVELMFSGGAPVTPAIVKTLKILPNLREVLIIYGLTECAPLIISYNCDDPTKFLDIPEGSVGVLAPGTTAKVINTESGELCGPGESGEVCFKCDGLFSGYYLHPQGPGYGFDNGFFKSGDVGYYDKDGYIFLVDRAKEIFKYFNNHISPTEIENIMVDHPAIGQVCVVGVPDPNGGGHVPRAFCVLNAGSKVTTQDILEYTNGKLAGYKHLRGGVYFLDELPQGKTGKVTRNLVEKIRVD